MEDRMQTALFADIDDFLRASCDRARASNIDRDATYALWNTHISLTTSEVEMLCVLAAGPLRTDAIAHRLGRDPLRTREFLDALDAGHVEADDG